MTEDYGNPSAKHKKGMEAEQYVRQAAADIAKTLKVRDKEILFTSGGTESNNMALIGTAMANQRAGKHIISTRIEHASVYNPLAYLEQQGFEVTYLSVDSQGHISLEELEARIRAQLRRRGHRPVDTTLRCGTLSLLDDQRTLMIEDRRITLTRHEYRIMELLMQSPGRAFSKREIYEYAWEDVFAADDKTVAVHISNIRGKCGRKDLIETVWGIGFRLNQEGR